jgi:hypothetical protein
LNCHGKVHRGEAAAGSGDRNDATANHTGGIVSANGVQDGIFWYATFPNNKLFAYDATDTSHELYVYISSPDYL